MAFLSLPVCGHTQTGFLFYGKLCFYETKHTSRGCSHNRHCPRVFHLAECRRGAAFAVFKLADEIAHIIKAGVHGDFCDRGVGCEQEGGCLIDTVFI